MDDFAHDTVDKALKIKKKWIAFVILRNRLLDTLRALKNVGLFPKISTGLKYIKGIDDIVDYHNGKRNREQTQKILNIAKWASYSFDHN